MLSGLIILLLRQIIKIINTEWDDSPETRTGGIIFALKTNKALNSIPDDSDRAFYIQGDEVIHEKNLDKIGLAIQKWKDNYRADGLLFTLLP